MKLTTWIAIRSNSCAEDLSGDDVVMTSYITIYKLNLFVNKLINLRTVNGTKFIFGDMIGNTRPDVLTHTCQQRICSLPGSTGSSK